MNDIVIKLGLWLAKRPYAQGFVMLIGGAATAQILPLAAMPILTRIYSPEDFAMFALCVAFLYALGPSVALRMDGAQLIASKNDEAEDLFMVGVINSVVVTATLLIIGLIVHRFHPIEFFDRVPGWLDVFLIVAILCDAFGRGVVGYLLRHKRFSTMMRIRILRSTIMVFLQLGLGFLTFGYPGLVLGVFCAAIAIAFYAERKTGLFTKTVQRKSWRRYWELMSKYRDYVLISAPGQMLNTVMHSLPAIFFVTLYPESVAGLVALALRAVQSGLQGIREAASSIFSRYMLQNMRERNNPVLAVLRTTLMLGGVAFICVMTLVLVGEDLFRIVFGARWSEAGRFAGILAPALGVQFVVSTLTGSIETARRNGLFGIWRVLAFSVLLIFFLRLDSSTPIDEALRMYATCTLMVYLALFGLVLYAAARPHASILDSSEPEQ